MAAYIAPDGLSQLEFNVPFQHKYGYIRDEGLSQARIF